MAQYTGAHVGKVDGKRLRAGCRMYIYMVNGSWEESLSVAGNLVLQYQENRLAI